MTVDHTPAPARGPRARIPGSRWHQHPGVRKGEQLTVGERAADAMRNGMGSWIFVFAFLAVMAFWMAINTIFHVGHPLSGSQKSFDPYPYILLNLVLSTMAGLQAAALLIAAKRSDAIASEVAVHTLHNTETDRKLLEENTELTRRIKEQTDLLNELHRHVNEISDRLGISPEPPEIPPAG